MRIHVDATHLRRLGSGLVDNDLCTSEVLLSMRSDACNLHLAESLVIFSLSLLLLFQSTTLRVLLFRLLQTLLLPLLLVHAKPPQHTDRGSKAGSEAPFFATPGCVSISGACTADVEERDKHIRFTEEMLLLRLFLRINDGEKRDSFSGTEELLPGF